MDEMNELMPILCKFHNLQTLQLNSCRWNQCQTYCSFCQASGKSRDSLLQRALMRDFSSSFHFILRPDLESCSLFGCLGEILQSLPTPLRGLSLKNCSLVVEDMEALAGWKHVASLWDLNLVKVSVL
ncbi:hypothetical protein ACOMHN_033893 [Nucella lapillus]